MNATSTTRVKALLGHPIGFFAVTIAYAWGCKRLK
jgi:hypothetical protein